MARLESLDPRIEELWNVSFGLTTEKGRSCRFNVAQESNRLIHLFFSMVFAQDFICHLDV